MNTIYRRSETDICTFSIIDDTNFSSTKIFRLEDTSASPLPPDVPTSQPVEDIVDGVNDNVVDNPLPLPMTSQIGHLLNALNESNILVNSIKDFLAILQTPSKIST